MSQYFLSLMFEPAAVSVAVADKPDNGRVWRVPPLPEVRVRVVGEVGQWDLHMASTQSDNVMVVTLLYNLDTSSSDRGSRRLSM